MTNDELRAKFEAWFSRRYGKSLTLDLTRYQHAKAGWQACHAAMQGGVSDEMIDRFIARYQELEPSDDIEPNAETREFTRQLLMAAMGERHG